MSTSPIGGASAAPIASFQGLASNVQWQDLVTQIVQADAARLLTPVQTQLTAEQAANTAWTNYGTAMSSLAAAVQSLSSGAAFDAAQVSVPNSPTTGRTLLTASATAAAQPGTYAVSVLATASAQQLSGNIETDPPVALGLSAGQILVSGQAVSLSATDSLNSIRDKINALNTGANATHVAATVLLSGSSNARLVLTDDRGGAAGVDLRDARATNAAPSLLQQLGVFDGTTANVDATGVLHSGQFASATGTIGALLPGVTVPSPGTITVGGQGVAVDFATQSLSDIAAAINAVSPGSAAVEPVTTGGTIRYRLAITGALGAPAAAQPILEQMGLVRGTTGAVAQQLSTSNALLAADGTPATTTTLLLGLNTGGTGAQVGDTFTIGGTKPDGITAVHLTETVDGSRTVDNLLTDVAAAFSAPNRPVTAALVNGRIQLTDTAGGDSGLTMSCVANNESNVATPGSGATLSFGATTVTAVGRARQLTAGADARLTVNGITLTRPSNTITDAVPGVTLTLDQAEAGTTLPVVVTQDTSQVVSAVQALATAYNTVRHLALKDTAPGGPLAFDGAMRASLASLRNVILTPVLGLTASAAYTQSTDLGLSVDKTGQLQVDTTALTAALAANPSAARALFATTGTLGDPTFAYVASTTRSQPGHYTVAVTHAATVATATSTAANFTYAANGGTDTMQVLDTTTGRTATIALATGATPTQVADALNAACTTGGLMLTASVSNGALILAQRTAGAAAGFQVSYTSNVGNNVAAQIGITAGLVQNGTDVVGSFSQGGVSYAATGTGQLLTGAAGTPAEGLAVRYTDTRDVATSSLDFALGIGGAFAQLGNQITAPNTGTIATQTQAHQNAIAASTTRAQEVQARLDRERAAMLAKFAAMESALARLQQQGQYLTSQLAILQNTGK